MNRTETAITTEDVFRAHQLLAAQFEAGNKNHNPSANTTGVGFRVA